MKKFLILFFGLVLVLMTVPGWAADDSKVVGLWVEIPDLPEASSTSFNVQSGGEGIAYYERTLGNGNLKVAVERIYSENNQGQTLTAADTGELTVRQAKIREDVDIVVDDLSVSESIDELSEKYGSPVSSAIYQTGEGEDIWGNQDIYIFTDKWIFRIHLSINAQHADDFDSEAMADWFNNLKFVDRNSATEDDQTQEAGTEEAQTDGGDSGDQVIELNASEADLSEAPDVVTEGSPQNLGGWHGKNIVMFRFDLEKAGAYSITLIYSKSEPDGDPADLVVSVKNVESSASVYGYYKIPPTGPDWSNYQERLLGTIANLEAGKTTLGLMSNDPKDGKYVMNLRAVILKPVD
jgi:hypothetical protein